MCLSDCLVCVPAPPGVFEPVCTTLVKKTYVQNYRTTGTERNMAQYRSRTLGVSTERMGQTKRSGEFNERRCAELKIRLCAAASSRA